jgi:hypothetical protein
LLKDDVWRTKGELAAHFIAETWNESNCLDEHIRIYEELLGESRR